MLVHDNNFINPTRLVPSVFCFWLILLTYVTDFSIEYRRAPIKRYVGMTLLTIRLA